MKRTLMILCAAASLTACDADDGDPQDRAGAGPEALDDHVSEMFQELDKDGNGSLSAAEVDGHRLGHKFDRADADGSGEVSREELSDFVEQMHGKHGKPGHHGKRGHDGECGGEGECGDAGECGHHGEQGEHGKHGGHDMGSPEEHAKKMIEKLDADGDGSVSVAEAAEKPHLADRFGELDGNGDGQLTEAELVEHHQRKRAEHEQRKSAEPDHAH